MQTSTDDLCNGLHPVFRDFLVYARNLEFSMKPDYDMLKHIFTTVYYQQGWKDSEFEDFDWSVSKQAADGTAVVPPPCEEDEDEDDDEFVPMDLDRPGGTAAGGTAAAAAAAAAAAGSMVAGSTAAVAERSHVYYHQYQGGSFEG